MLIARGIRWWDAAILLAPCEKFVGRGGWQREIPAVRSAGGLSPTFTKNGLSNHYTGESRV